MMVGRGHREDIGNEAVLVIDETEVNQNSLIENE